MLTSPATSGSILIAALTAAGVTGLSSRIRNAVSRRARLPLMRVAAMLPEPACAVSTAERTGDRRAPPSAALAALDTVRTYRVSARHWLSGAIVRTRPASSQAKLTAVSGWSRKAAATVDGSIGPSNSTVNGFVRPCPVVTASRTRAATGGGLLDTGTALLWAGGRPATTMSATTIAAPRPAPKRAIPPRPRSTA